MSAGTGLPVIEVVRPIPGFPDVRHFTLAHLDDEGVLGELRALGTDGLRFLTVPANVFYPDYAPVIDDETAEQLAISDVNTVLVLLVVHAGPSLAETTVNLRAPFIVDTLSGRAAQVILDDPALAVDAPLLG